ncbi:MAG TPA: sugar ABC transporter permease [Bacillota bacterium]|nr:sugar ABC transporter permease [Bacillota bacterium]
MKGWQSHRSRMAYWFVGPWLLGFFGFTVYPLLFSLYASMNDWTFESMTWNGINNYKWIFTDPQFWRCAAGTLGFAVISTPVTLIFALLLALLIHQKIKGIKAFRAIYFLPVVAASDVIATAAGNLLFGRILVLNLDLSQFGITVTPEMGPYLYFGAMLLTISLWRTGIQMLIFLLGLENVSEDLYEAAEMDGATEWQKFWWVTIPSIAPMIVLNVILTIIESFTGLATSMKMLTGGYFQIFIWDYINNLAFSENSFGPALAVVWVFILFMMTIVFFAFRKMEKNLSF